jgi:SAM-dependent methyltransferase
MRHLIGNTDLERFQTPRGAGALPELPEECYEAVLDFGCGCGRMARQLILRTPRPLRYLGLDLHAGMIQWCRTHLTPLAPEFEFVRQDVFNPGLNPKGTALVSAFPAADAAFTLVLAYFGVHAPDRSQRPPLSDARPPGSCGRPAAPSRRGSCSTRPPFP